MKNPVFIPKHEWQTFLEDFTEQNRHRPVRIETHDLETKETVTSGQMRLRSVDFDVEDVHHPRINVNVQIDNKTIKEILFMPSELAVAYDDAARKTLRIHSVNTFTTLHFQEPRT